MSVTQTVEIPASRRVNLDFEVPIEIPIGKAQIEVKVIPFVKKREKMTDAQELELIRCNAERLNREALDVLSFQSLDL
jgi:hypothetical protein